MKRSGKIYEFTSAKDGSVKLGIVYDKDQNDLLRGMKKVMVTLVDQNYVPLDSPKILKDIDKLKLKGFVD